MLKVLDLFSGIGGFSLGLERAGMTTVAFCEIEPFCQKVLAKHWPDVYIHNDVKTLSYGRFGDDPDDWILYDSEADHEICRGAIDVITGGFPCQDISVAGKQKGIGEGTRSGLWSECARLLGDIRPRYAIFENVPALLSGDNGRWFEQVLWDISQVGYDAEWHCIPASELGAHHHRDRVWIIAYPNSQGFQRVTYSRDSQKTSAPVLSRPIFSRVRGTNHWPVCDALSALGGNANGVSKRLHRVKALGNAVVPQIPEIIGRAIMRRAAEDKAIEIIAGMNSNQPGEA